MKDRDYKDQEDYCAHLAKIPAYLRARVEALFKEFAVLDEASGDEPGHPDGENLADIAFIWACDDIAEIEIEAEKCSQDATAALESLYRHMTQAERLWAKVRVLRSQVEVICPEYRTVDESVRTSRECLESLELLR